MAAGHMRKDAAFLALLLLTSLVACSSGLAEAGEDGGSSSSEGEDDSGKGYSYCQGGGEEDNMCQNCRGSCYSACGSKPHTKGQSCKFPHGAGGDEPDDELCDKKSSGGSGSEDDSSEDEGKQVWELPLRVARIRLFGSSEPESEFEDGNGIFVYEQVGRLVVWQSEERHLEAIALLDCPWLAWSSDTGGGTDENHQLSVLYRTRGQDGDDTFTELKIPFEQANVSKPDGGSGYYSCIKFSKQLDDPNGSGSSEDSDGGSESERSEGSGSGGSEGEGSGGSESEDDRRKLSWWGWWRWQHRIQGSESSDSEGGGKKW